MFQYIASTPTSKEQKNTRYSLDLKPSCTNNQLYPSTNSSRRGDFPLKLFSLYEKKKKEKANGETHVARSTDLSSPQ